MSASTNRNFNFVSEPSRGELTFKKRSEVMQLPAQKRVEKLTEKSLDGKTMKNTKPDGVHFLASFYGTDIGQTDSEEFWRSLLHDALEGTSIYVLGSDFHKFDPQGLTGMFLLSASHASFHTWPERDGYVVLDFFSCSGDEEARKVMDFIERRIAHKRVEIRRVSRGYAVQPDAVEELLLVSK